MTSASGLNGALQLARSLGFGGVVGASLGLAARRVLPTLPISESEAMYFGAAVGAILSRVLDSAVNWILAPVSRFVGFYFKLAQLYLLSAVIPKKQRDAIIKDLTSRHFLR